MLSLEPSDGPSNSTDEGAPENEFPVDQQGVSAPVILLPGTANFRDEQLRNLEVQELIQFLESGNLPQDEMRARKMAQQSSQFTLMNGVVYYKT